MNSDPEEEDTGPSVDSADPEERIKARRLRIQKRIEAKRRYVRVPYSYARTYSHDFCCIRSYLSNY